MPGIMNLDSVACARCENGFEPKAKIVNSNGTLYCHGCFVCAQCFRPFQDNVFFEFEDRKYCEHCFQAYRNADASRRQQQAVARGRGAFGGAGGSVGRAAVLTTDCLLPTVQNRWVERLY